MSEGCAFHPDARKVVCRNCMGPRAAEIAELRAAVVSLLDVAEDVLDQWEGEPRKLGEIQVKKIVSDARAVLGVWE